MFLTPSTFPWDLAILLLIAGPFCILTIAAVALRRAEGWKARTALHALSLLCFTVAMTVLYGSFLEPRLITVTERRVPLPYSEQLTIAVISDLHAGPYKGAAFLQRVVDRVNALRPDLVLYAGDFLFDKDSAFRDLKPLGGLTPSLGTVAVFGNHDMGRMRTPLGRRYEMADRSVELREYLQGLGVTVLRNENILYRTSRGAVAVAGAGDLWAGDVDLTKALDLIPEDHAVILLSHNPDIILQEESKQADLIVSGHTHGGQFRLPWIGPLAPIPLRIGKQYSQGAFPLQGGGTLVVTRGIGETQARARLFAPPEILLLKTTPEP